MYVPRASTTACNPEVGELRLFNNNTELVTQHTGQAHIAWPTAFVTRLLYILSNPT